MNCKEAQQLLMDIDHLSAAQEESLAEHAKTCAGCAQELASLRSMIGLTQRLQAVDVLANESRMRITPAAPVVAEAGQRTWMPGLAGRLSPWLAAASFLLAGLFVYEQIPAIQPSAPGSGNAGATLNVSSYKRQLNKLRDTRTYRANLLCRSPYRKPEQVAQCVRQKFSSL